MPNLKNKVAIITGSSSGIGAGTAIHFASLGCNVIITARNAIKLEKVNQECIAAGLKPNQVLLILGDITDESIQNKIIQKTIDQFGKLDILVNNAGLMRPVKLDGGNIEDFDLVMKTNFRAPFQMMQLAVPFLKKTKGNIINISSVSARRVFVGGSAYVASKCALDATTKTAALELGVFGVRVNSIQPGAVVTDVLMNTNENMTEAKSNEIWKNLERVHALKRVGRVEEQAKIIAFLASEDASFITGSLYLVDGGQNLIGFSENFL